MMMCRFVGRNRSGFTLVEILLVVVIIGILAGLIVTRLSGKTEDARIARAKADMAGSLSLALDLLEQDVGRYPTTEEGLEALVTNPGIPGWERSYLKGGLKDDPWGTPYVYSYTADGGPDGQPDTEDDIYP
jgi:general secretion pathway protein G